jgi:hypothetical protein
VAERRIDLAARPGRDGREPRRLLLLALGCLALVGLGVTIGSRLASHGAAQQATVTISVPAPTAGNDSARTGTPQRGPAGGFPRTASGAVAAASTFIGALDGGALLDRARLGAIIHADAAPSTSDRLLLAYDQATTQAREELGLGTVPTPVVIIRAASVGYRLEQFSPGAAVVSVWRVGIIGSGATVQPEQSWRTDTISLLWTDRGWKIATLTSQPGPTPPLASGAVSTPAELFVSIPRFEEFTNVDP